MKKLFILFTLLISSNSFAQCIYGDCKNGYGRFKNKNLLYCGNFIDKKMNGDIMIFDLFEKAIHPNWTYNETHGISQKLQKQEKYYEKWLPICVVNYSNGNRTDNKGKYLFRDAVALNNFNLDLRTYRSYYDGELDEALFPHGVGNVYTENIYYSNGSKIMIADSIVYSHGSAISAKSFNQNIGDGTQGIYYNVKFNTNKWDYFKQYEKTLPMNQLYEFLILNNYGFSGLLKSYYDSPTNKVLASEQNVTREGKNNRFELTFNGPIKKYTPDGTLVYEGYKELEPSFNNPLPAKCISGNCKNGSGKIVLSMPISVNNMWYTDGNPKREKLSSGYPICVFEGRFKDGKPIGSFKMWNTYGYEFSGIINDNFSLKSGKISNNLGEINVSYQGNFGPNSEMMDGLISGPFGRFRITKEREWIKE